MASKRRVRRRSCESKRRFATQTEAVGAAKAASKNRGVYMGTYRCRFCHRWHFGRPKGKGAQP